MDLDFDELLPGDDPPKKATMGTKARTKASTAKQPATKMTAATKMTVDPPQMKKKPSVAEQRAESPMSNSDVSSETSGAPPSTVP